MAAFPSLSPSASVAIGILVGLLSTCIQSLGLTLQRKSHILEDEKAHNNHSASPARPAYRRRRWQVGMLIFLLANIVGSSIQITTLPLPLLSTLQASGLVFNSILASLLLKEQFTIRTGYGTLLVAGGAVLISLFSALPEPSHNLDQLIALLGYQSFLLWFILSLVLVLVLLAMDFTMRRLLSQSKRDSPRLLLVRGMGYGAISGILSAHGLLLAKSAVELIVRSFADKENQFRNYRSWLLVLAFLVLALSQLYYLHLGLRLISTSVLYPFVFCIYNIVAILDGLIYFRQMDRLPPLHAGLIALGTVILLAGVLALSWRLEDSGEAGDTEHRHQMAQHEIPQTVLTPGLGFVGDPEDDEDDSETTDSAIVDEDDYRDLETGLDAEGSRDEEEPLITKALKRASTSKSNGSSHKPRSTSKRRKRASTLKDVLDIWEELGDDHRKGDEEEEEAYGTFPPPHERRRPASAGDITRQNRHARFENPPPPSRPNDGHLTNGDTAGLNQNEALPTQDPHPRHANTLPPTVPAPSDHRSHSGRRRRRSTHGTSAAPGSGALFRDMLTADWWRASDRRRQRRRSEGGDVVDAGGMDMHGRMGER
ncbi:hypothetical protein LTR78_008611 [Recurvomyces mirabilis]|uniref:Uncharacterized protein n=1 Tax=Recurvomyces mirabilis TaxID=574656 RepID=A0AAE0TUJ0_9PEZI|nr:hypothetical protein LTR78_008611 [Recurvomyces mirabilis]KAK5153477.1 hypothetical protein LTS14_007648 [Recurvomyces mirabilis]